MEENEIVAVMIKAETFGSVMQFLSIQPYNQVANLLRDMQQSQGFGEEQLKVLQDFEAENAAEAPE